MIDVISNVAGQSHQECLAAMLRNSDEAIFVSPFIFDDFSHWLDANDLGALRCFTLITTLAPTGQDQLLKPSALLSLVHEAKKRWPKLNVVVQIDNLLHGKIYLFKRNGSYLGGVVTSANFTRSGLSIKHEWGIRIDDAELLAKIHGQVVSAVQYPLITIEMLQMLAVFADQWRRDHPDVLPSVDVDASLFYALRMAPTADKFRVFPGWENIERIFLKPKGDRDRPILKVQQEKFGEQTGTLAFPKGRPSDVRKGDVIVTFGTGDRCILGVHRVLSEPEERSSEEQTQDEDARRWPWYVHAENFTPNFGNSWWVQDITIDDVADEYIAANPDTQISDAGSKSLGAFNFGAGRLRLSKEFGQFVAERILKIETALKPST